MSRPLRLEFAGAVWHVMARGNDRKPIFADDRDREVLLEVLGRVVAATRWRVHAYVLMPNHYHLLLETPEPNLSRGMRQLNGVYTQRVNVRHGRTGHVFQGRFKGILVERDAHLLELCRYLVLNPVRAGLVSAPGDWPFSSYRATAGLAPPPAWLETAWTLDQFESARGSRTQAFRAFVAAGVGSGYSPWEEVEDQLYLGGAAFRARLQAVRPDVARAPEIPRAQRALVRPTLETIVREVCAASELGPSALLRRNASTGRMQVAWLGRNEGGLPLGEIAPALGATVWTVSRLESRAEALRGTDAGFRRTLEALRSRLYAERAASTGPAPRGGTRKSQNKT